MHAIKNWLQNNKKLYPVFIGSAVVFFILLLIIIVSAWNAVQKRPAIPDKGEVTESQLAMCTQGSDCILVDYYDCCVPPQRAINKTYKDEYMRHPEWQSPSEERLDFCSRVFCVPPQFFDTATCVDNKCLPVRSSEEDDTTNWQTYRNDELGFDLKYPSAFVISGSLEDAVLFRDISGDVVVQMTLANSIECHPDAPKEQCKIVSTQEGVDITFRYFDIAPDEATIELLPQIALYSILPCKNSGDGSPNQGVSFCETLIERTLFEQVLSTFKFIEQVDISEWQTYSNEQLSFEVKYPSTILAGKLPGLKRGVSLTFQEDARYLVNERIEIVLGCGDQNIFYKTTGTTVKNGITFDVGEWFEGAAGPNYYGAVYNTKKGEECYRLTYVRGKGSGGFYSGDPQEIERIDSEIKGEDDKYAAIFDQIVSTFRFIE